MRVATAARIVAHAMIACLRRSRRRRTYRRAPRPRARRQVPSGPGAPRRSGRAWGRASRRCSDARAAARPLALSARGRRFRVRSSRWRRRAPHLCRSAEVPRHPPPLVVTPRDVPGPPRATRTRFAGDRGPRRRGRIRPNELRGPRRRGRVRRDDVPGRRRGAFDQASNVPGLQTRRAPRSERRHMSRSSPVPRAGAPSELSVPSALSLRPPPQSRQRARGAFARSLRSRHHPYARSSALSRVRPR